MRPSISLCLTVARKASVERCAPLARRLPAHLPARKRGSWSCRGGDDAEALSRSQKYSRREFGIHGVAGKEMTRAHLCATIQRLVFALVGNQGSKRRPAI